MLTPQEIAQLRDLAYTVELPVWGDNPTMREFLAINLPAFVTDTLDCDGMEGLRVAARSSSFAFKGKKIDVKEVGEKLNVASILEGTVRRAGPRLKVTAELVSVRDGLTLWSDSWDREVKEVFAVQEEISRAIVAALRLTLTGGAAEKIASHGTANPQAHDLYLRGRFHTNRFMRRDLEHSLDLYRQALAIDSNYALAYVGLADSYVNLADDWLAPLDAYPKAKEERAQGARARRPERGGAFVAGHDPPLVRLERCRHRKRASPRDRTQSELLAGVSLPRPTARY
jgi:hypothetical protein